MSNSFLQRPVRLGGGNTKTHQIIQISIFKIEENWTKLLFKLRVSFYALDWRNSEKRILRLAMTWCSKIRWWDNFRGKLYLLNFDFLSFDHIEYPNAFYILEPTKLRLGNENSIKIRSLLKRRRGQCTFSNLHRHSHPEAAQRTHLTAMHCGKVGGVTWHLVRILHI